MYHNPLNVIFPFLLLSQLPLQMSSSSVHPKVPRFLFLLFLLLSSRSLFRASWCGPTLHTSCQVPFHATVALVGVSGPFSMEFLRHSALLHTQCKFNQLLCVDIVFPIKSQNGVVPRAGDRKPLSILPHLHRFYKIHESHENYVFRNYSIMRASLYYNIKFK